MDKKEAIITINGTALTEAQSMTVRVALETLGLELALNGLGDDATGKGICDGYLKNLTEINHILYK